MTSIQTPSLIVLTKLRKVTISFVMSVRLSIPLCICLSAWNNSAPIRWIFTKFDVRAFLENLSRKIKFH